MKAKFHLGLLNVCLLILSLTLESEQTEYLTKDKDICRLFKDGAKLRKPGTCHSEIKCMNFVSTDSQDCRDKSSQPYYNVVTAKCQKTEPTDAYCAHPCSKSSPIFVQDPKNCHNYYQCNGKVKVNFAACPNNMCLDQAKQMCVYEEQSTCVAKFEFCDVVPPKTTFRDEINCDKYYQCDSRKTGLKTKLVLTSYDCPAGKYYDVTSGECIAKALVNCSVHPRPENVCGTNKLAYRNQFVDDRATCRGYFYCRDNGVGKPDLNPIWGQCPLGEYFEPSEQACIVASGVRCNEDRCDSLSGVRTLSGKSGCQHYLECMDGHTVNEVYCGDGMWFDTETLACTTLRKSYKACS